jgi:hypothetical protein
LRIGGGRFLVEASFLGGKTRIGEEHRTEGTEVTEGIKDWRGKVFGGKLRFWAGKTRIEEKHRTEVTEVTEGD